MIGIENLSFRYPGAEFDAIQGLSLEIRRGSLFGLLGPNGSGKTTLISVLTGLLVPASGRIRIDGKAMPEQARQIQAFSALVPQEYAFYPQLGVLENLKFFGAALAIPRLELQRRLEQVLVVAGLGSFTGTRAEHLSGGLKRRLNLAIGLLNRPQLLFLDEPTVGIDPQSRHFILEAIKQINAEGTTIIYTSHYMEEVEMLCDEIGILDNGRLLARGTLQQLLNDASGQALTVTFATPLSEQQRGVFISEAGVEPGNQVLHVQHCSDSELQKVLGVLAREGLSITRMQYGYGNLEELFLHLTGRQLRD